MKTDVTSDRCFPIDERARELARRLYMSVRDLPIVSPHGHTDPGWFASNAAFQDPFSLLIAPDHYILRMLMSQGIPLEQLRGPGIDPRSAWKLFAEHYFLFRATPTSLWLGSVLRDIFEIAEPLNASTADSFYSTISRALASPEFKPRVLFDRFKIEVLATTDSPVPDSFRDSLEHHRAIAREWPKRIIPTYRPDSCVDPEHPSFRENIARLGKLTDEDMRSYESLLRAHVKRRREFQAMGATATDHGHPSAKTLALSPSDATQLFERVLHGASAPSAQDAEDFRALMLVEMARMSLEDGLVMQLHPGSFRNYNRDLFARHGTDIGADIPVATEYTRNLKPLLDEVGSDPRFRLILFTLDESTYSRELAPLAGHYASVLLGPPWWFHDSPEGMLRFREQTTETAGFYNTAGFVDDTRAFFSIPARHDLARRMDARFLATWVLEHRLTEAEAFEVIHDLSYRLVKKAYRL